MRISLLFFLFIWVAPKGYGQNFPANKSRNSWHFYSAGAGYVDGTMQFFEGYNYRILYANSRSGMPIRSDWDLYSQLSTFPKWYQGNVWVQFADTIKKLRIRVNASLFSRKDSMIYTSALGMNDIVYGRIAVEKGYYGAIGLGLAKTTKKLLKSLFLYGGAEVQAGFSLGSNVNFVEYGVDVVTGNLAFMDEYQAKGRFRIVPIFSALLGMEFRPISWLGLVLEAQSGIGVHYVINQSAFGVSRTCLLGGLAFYPQSLRKKIQ